jgi:hypothetical protein
MPNYQMLMLLFMIVSDHVRLLPFILAKFLIVEGRALKLPKQRTWQIVLISKQCYLKMSLDYDIMPILRQSLIRTVEIHIYAPFIYSLS